MLTIPRPPSEPATLTWAQPFSRLTAIPTNSARFAAGRCAAAVADLSGCGAPQCRAAPSLHRLRECPDDRPWFWRTAGAGMNILRRHHAGRGALLDVGFAGKEVAGMASGRGRFAGAIRRRSSDLWRNSSGITRLAHRPLDGAMNASDDLHICRDMRRFESRKYEQLCVAM